MFRLTRPDGVHLLECWGGSHTHLVGAPVPRERTLLPLSERPCEAKLAPGCRGFIELNRRNTTMCLECNPAARYVQSAQRLKRKPRCTFCMKMRADSPTPCAACGGLSRNRRRNIQRCSACTRSLSNNHGPCAKHGGRSTAERERERAMIRRHRRRVAARRLGLTRVRPSTRARSAPRPVYA